MKHGANTQSERKRYFNQQLCQGPEVSGRSRIQMDHNSLWFYLFAIRLKRSARLGFIIKRLLGATVCGVRTAQPPCVPEHLHEPLGQPGC